MRINKTAVTTAIVQGLEFEKEETTFRTLLFAVWKIWMLVRLSYIRMRNLVSPAIHFLVS
jgi:hypothetical protein